jgi:hypothetical protein
MRVARSRTQQVANLEPERTEDLIYDYEGDSSECPCSHERNFTNSK